MKLTWISAFLVAAVCAPTALAAQERGDLDRVDPAVIEQEVDPPETLPRPQPSLTITAPNAEDALAGSQEVVAGAIRVTGTRRLPASAFAAAIEPFLGQALAHGDLVRLATSVAGVARRAGYGLATAWVPAQALNDGVLVVQVDEGSIDAIRASGPGAALVEQRLAFLVGSGPVRTETLERQLLLAGDVSGLWVGDVRLTRDGGRNVLILATRHQRVQGRVAIDNWGSDRVGPVRAWAEIDVNGVMRAGDGLLLGVATTPLEPDTFQLVEARYRLPLGGRGTTLAVGGYYGRTDVAPDQARSGFQGDSWEIEVAAAYPLARSRARSLWVTGQIEVRDSAIDRAGSRVRDDRIVSATLSVHGFDRFAGGRLRARASLVQGLDVLDATDLGDPLASRADASGVFSKVEAWAEYWRPLGGGFSTVLAVRSQLADGPLLSSEEIGLGGPSFLRAFDYRERSGDQGAAASVELRFDIRNLTQTIDNIQFYGYADAGRVEDRGSGRRGGELASAGGGVRLSFASHWDAAIELGVPLSDGGDDRDPQPRFSFSLRTKF